MKDASLYLFDEITPYLDIYQRINVAKLIRDLCSEKEVIIVEHDLAILDLLTDIVHITYGTPTVYGVITNPKGTRVGINEYLKGFLRDENVRIREYPIEFEIHAPREDVEEGQEFWEYNAFSKSINGFNLSVNQGKIGLGKVVGIVGPNATGKSTFVKILSGEMTPSEGEIEQHEVAVKPQYITFTQDFTVRELLRRKTRGFGSSIFRSQLLVPLQLEELLDRKVSTLSGGELQRVAIAVTLGSDAEIYMLDEPSAHLDVEQRSQAISTIRRFSESGDKTALVVDHDIYLIDLISNNLIVFNGVPAVNGQTSEPLSMEDGMNMFLKGVDITFRRDESGRPRINKPQSKLDRMQKEKNQYYYVTR